MTQPSSLILVDADLHGLETLTYGFEREGWKVTRTSDLSRAVQLSRTSPSPPGLAVVMLREPVQPALDVIAGLHGAHRNMPILALGDASLQTGARAAGASDFLRTPTYIRDAVNVGKLNAYGDDGEGLLSEYHGLFYLLRAMSAVGRSGVLRLGRGTQRAEIRFKDGKVVSASVRALQNLPALHHVLLWEEAKVSIAGGVVAKPSQFPLSSQEILDESERFLRDFAHAARDLGPPNTIYQPVPEPRPVIAGLQPNQMAPLLKLFDGKHGLADVVEESPFRIFDTIRMIRRLVEGGVLTTRAARRPSGQQPAVDAVRSARAGSAGRRRRPSPPESACAAVRNAGSDAAANARANPGADSAHAQEAPVGRDPRPGGAVRRNSAREEAFQSRRPRPRTDRAGEGRHRRHTAGAAAGAAHDAGAATDRAAGRRAAGRRAAGRRAAAC